MNHSRQGFAFAKRSASVALAATLAVASVPAVALVQAGTGSETTPIAMAAEGDYIVEGKEYTVPVTSYGGSPYDDIGKRYWGDNAYVTYQNGAYTLKLKNTAAADGVDPFYLTYNGQQVDAVDGAFSFTFETLPESFQIQITAGKMPLNPTATVALDLSGLPEVEPEPEPEPEPTPEPGDSDLVADELYTVPLDLGESMAGRMLGENALVTLNDNGTYDVTITVAASKAYCFSGLTVAGVSASKAYSADGAWYVFTAKGVPSLAGDVELGFTYTPYGMWRTMTHSANATFGIASASADASMPAVQQGAVKTDLQNTIAQAEAIEQGSKSDEAWATFQEAIETAQTAPADEMIPQADIDAVTTTLIEAIQVFNASEDVQAPSTDEGDDPALSGDTYGMEVGTVYTADVSYAGTGSFASDFMNQMLQEMVGKYFGNEVRVQLLDDGTFDVTVFFGGTTGYSDAIGDITYNGTAVKQAADQTYTFNVASLSEPIELALHVGGSMDMDITYAMTVDTASLEAQQSDSDGPASVEVDKSALESLINQAAAIEQGSKTDASYATLQQAIASARGVLGNPDAIQAQVNSAVEALQKAIDTFNASQAVKFQKGHTYQVPIDFLKHNSSETSMADQYFGDTALVRVGDDGATMKVTFAATDEGMTHIIELAYNGANISAGGNQFAVSIPYTESDTVIPVSMTIKEMQELGGPAQTADLHLYLTQATDLGTGQASLAASSASSMPSTGDNAPVAVAGAVALATAAAVAAVAGSKARRRILRDE